MLGWLMELSGRLGNLTGMIMLLESILTQNQ